MLRRFAASYPLLTAALAGAVLGLVGAVLLLRFGDPPGTGTLTRSNAIFLLVSLPARAWHMIVFGWVWGGRRTAEFLTLLSLNGALWGMGLTALARAMRRSPRARRIALGSTVAGSALAGFVWTVGIPDQGPWEGAAGLIFLAQIPGMTLLAFAGYGTHFYDGTMVDGLYRPGPQTLLLFSLANALLMAGLARVAAFTWHWLRAPMPRTCPAGLTRHRLSRAGHES